MPAHSPVTDHELARIRELHGQGLSCSAIARDLGRATSTVARKAAEMNLGWDNAQTAAATNAKQQSNRDRRADQIKRLYDRADAIWERLAADGFKVVGFDKMGYARVTTIDPDAIPGTEERALTGIAINCLVAAARLEAIDAGHSGATEARGILGALSDALNGAYGSLGGRPTPKHPESEPEA